MRVVSYGAFKNRFTSAIGVDTLLTAEETALKRSLTDRVRGGMDTIQMARADKRRN